MSSNPQPDLPPESEIRSLVATIVDAVLGDGGEPAAPPDPVPPAPEETSTVETAATAGAVAIAIGADHGGYPLKERLAFKLREAGYEVVDCGTDSLDPVDYPDFAHAVAERVASGSCTWGIVVDGAGIGSAMAANKVPGVRAALCYDLSTARNSREHNHANVLTLGAGLVGDGLAWQIVTEWLAVPFGGGRHGRRVAKITAIEDRYARSGAAVS
jgi:ribose 5-phosphate isomerase B